MKPLINHQPPDINHHANTARCEKSKPSNAKELTDRRTDTMLHSGPEQEPGTRRIIRTAQPLKWTRKKKAVVTEKEAFSFTEHDPKQKQYWLKNHSLEPGDIEVLSYRCPMPASNLLIDARISMQWSTRARTYVLVMVEASNREILFQRKEH